MLLNYTVVDDDLGKCCHRGIRLKYIYIHKGACKCEIHRRQLSENSDFKENDVILY